VRQAQFQDSVDRVRSTFDASGHNQHVTIVPKCVISIVFPSASFEVRIHGCLLEEVSHGPRAPRRSGAGVGVRPFLPAPKVVPAST
jgi:hypothetical protein